MQKICIRAQINGKVQGVCYRDSTCRKAKELHLTGWVKNLPSGEVELLACGDLNTITLFIEWLWQGPPAAKVDHVQWVEVEWQSLKDFTIIWN